MKFISFSERIEPESFEGFLEALNSFDKEEEITLFFSTEGGRMPEGRNIVETIKLDDRIKHIIFTTQILSCGFFIFIKLIKECKGKKKFSIMKNTFGMTHLPVFNGSLYGKEGSEFMPEIFKIENEEMLEISREFLSEKQLDQFNNKRDVYFTCEELENILQNIK